MHEAVDIVPEQRGVDLLPVQGLFGIVGQFLHQRCVEFFVQQNVRRGDSMSLDERARLFLDAFEFHDYIRQTTERRV